MTEEEKIDREISTELKIVKDEIRDFPKVDFQNEGVYATRIVRLLRNVTTVVLAMSERGGFRVAPLDVEWIHHCRNQVLPLFADVIKFTHKQEPFEGDPHFFDPRDEFNAAYLHKRVLLHRVNAVDEQLKALLPPEESPQTSATPQQ